MEHQEVAEECPKGVLKGPRGQKVVQMGPVTPQQLQNFRAQNRMAQPRRKSGELLRICRPQIPAPKVNKRPQSTGKLVKD